MKVLPEISKFTAVSPVSEIPCAFLSKVIENTVNVEKAGTYKVKYSLTDSYGDTVTKEIEVTVTMLEEKDNDWRKHSWKIKMKLDQTVLTVDNDIRLAEMQTGDKDKTTIKKMKTGRKYMAKCSEELEKLLVS